MKTYLPIILICLLGVGLRIGWMNYTDYTAEDAYITFQFARQVADGNEFSFNTGQPIYGTTTPLLTILLSVWRWAGWDIVLGSKLIALAAFAGGLWMLYFALRPAPAIVSTFLISASPLLIAQDMSGMENALLFFFMAGALRGLTLGEPVLSGLMCGFLLWTRVDSAVFVVAILLAHFVDRKSMLSFLAGTLIYLPWLAFAWWYFGDPVPFTITAKTVAYGINSPPFNEHLTRVTDYLSLWTFILILLAGVVSSRRTVFLPLFFVANTLLLCFSGSTFFDRYFYTFTVAGILIVSLALARIKNTAIVVLATLVLVILPFNKAEHVDSYAIKQRDRHVHLKEIGLWLNSNTPPESTVQLEPLGYIGYYAQRVMLDEVGLVTPAVVDLHRQRIRAENFYQYLKTDYILLQCGQADKVMMEFSQEYTLIKEFTQGSARACYEVWKHE